MIKKKVSFDIDQELLNNIKSLCKIKGMKLADFFRDASLEKMRIEEIFMTIFIAIGGKIKKFTIKKEDYEIDIFQASENLTIDIGAKCEGVIRLKGEAGESELDQLIDSEIEKKISFFTTNKYC